MSSEATKALNSSLSKLQIQQKTSKPKKPEPADSWEDEADASSDTETEEVSTPIRPSSSDYPEPPPPTPSSPNTAARSRDIHYQPFNFDGASFEAAPRSATTGGNEDRRPDKTTSVASRLIAAGIGQKAPKRTKEQREYDQAMRVQEKKKRDQAQAEEERRKKEKEQAQKDIWGD